MRFQEADAQTFFQTYKFIIMKKIPAVCSALIILILCGCTGNKNITASKIGLVRLNSYFTKNTVELPDEVNFRVFTKATDFDSTFGVAQTMDTNVVRPDFNGQIVVAVLNHSTNRETKVQIESAEVIGQDINVYYSVVDTGKVLGFTTSPNAVAAIPKVASAKQVNFYTAGTKVKTLALQ